MKHNSAPEAATVLAGWDSSVGRVPPGAPSILNAQPSSLIGFVILLLLALAAFSARGAGLQTLHGHVPPVVNALTPTGRVPGTNRLKLALGLPLRNPAALAHLLQQIYDPASPNYHHYLTQPEFTGRFGPAEQDYQAIIAFARTNHLQVTTTHPNRLLLDVSGTAAEVERTFHLTLHTYQHPKENRTFYAPDQEPSLALAVPVLHIGGLDNYARPRPQLHATRLVSGQSASANAGSGPSGTYLGSDFRAAYVPGVSLNGLGQTVGLLQFDGYTPADITYYEQLAGLPSVTLTNVLIDGATGYPSGSGGEVEVSLDIEMAIAMAPGLSEVILYLASSDSPFEDILSRMATDNLASQLSCSWYEFNGSASPLADQIWQEMAAQGQSFYNASGDYGAYTGLIDFPGDSPYITQVGGTTLTTSLPGGSWVSEQVWNWGDGIASGGGISTQYPIPSWQTTLSMTANEGSITMRNTPDVALTADNVYVRADGVDYLVGGTSCAAPLWAGFTALVNQQAANNRQPSAGFINPAVYALGGGTNYGSVFHDITVGNNAGAYNSIGFPAVSGYDLCTGWGTPAGQSLINALVGSPVPAPPAIVTQPQSQTVGTAGTAVFHVAVIGLPPLFFQWSFNGTNLAGATNISLLVPDVQPNQAGVYAVQVTNTLGSVGSSNAVLQVTPPYPPAVVSQPENQAVVAGGNGFFNVVAIGTPPLQYQWSCQGTNIAGATNNPLILINVQPACDGYYAVQVSNQVSSLTSSNALLTVLPPNTSSAAVPSGLVSWWPAEGSANDAAGANHGTLQGGVTFVPGEVGKAFCFDGVNSDVYVPAASNLNLGAGAGLTLEAWINPTSVTQAQALITWGDAPLPFGNGVSLSIASPMYNRGSRAHGPGCLVADIADTSLDDHIILTPTNTLLTNVWQHVAVTFDQANGTTALFVNGSMVVSTNFGSLTPQTEPDVWLGSDGARVNGTFYYAGLMDEVSLYNRALTLWEIQAIYQAGNYGKSPLPPTLASLEPASQSVDPGATATFTALANGTPPLSYQWSLNGRPFPATTNSTLTLSNVQALQAGNYRLQVSNAMGACVSSNALLALNLPLPPVIVLQPTSQTVAEQQNVNFGVLAAGETPLTYHWSFDGTTISGATSSLLTLTNVMPNQSGNYAVLVSNTWGTAASSNALLTVQPWLLPAIVSQPAGQEIAASEMATFNVTASGTGPLSYQWEFDGTNIPGAVDSVLTLTNVQPTNAGSYGVLVTSPYGAAQSGKASLTVLPYPGWHLTSTLYTNWTAVASSSDGTKLVAVAGPGSQSSTTSGCILTSTNSGASWVSSTLPPVDTMFSLGWRSVASSADGGKLVAAYQFSAYGCLYVSTNSGATWTLTSAPNYQWDRVAASADGTKLVAASNGGDGPVYTSTNSGATWTRTSAPTNFWWTSVASSANGNFLVGVCAGTDYSSTDSGNTWTLSGVAQNGSVACSADGTKLVLAAYTGGIWISTNSGAAWISTSAPSNVWTAVVSSADGSRLAAVTAGSWIYSSADSGVTWAISGPSANWSSVASSADGRRLVAAVNGGGIYVWQSAPSLAARPQGKNWLLSWPSFWSGTGLQQSSDLARTNWINAPAALTLTNGLNEVFVTPTNAQEFFRLKYP